jgi:hypothetical protein
VEELLIFDPLALEGKSPAWPPYVLQLYRRGKEGELKQVYAGAGPVWSKGLRVWFRAEGGRVTVTRDREGKSPVLRAEETERWWDALEEERKARKIAERQAQAERLAKETAEQKAQTAKRQALQDAREAISDLCELLAIPLTPDRLAHLASLDLPALRDLRALLKQRKTWPD